MRAEHHSTSEAGLGAAFAELYRGRLRYRHGSDIWLMKGPDGWVTDRRGAVFDAAVYFLAGAAVGHNAATQVRLGRLRTARAVLTIAAGKPWIAASRTEAIEPRAEYDLLG